MPLFFATSSTAIFYETGFRNVLNTLENRIFGGYTVMNREEAYARSSPKYNAGFEETD